MNEIYTFNPEDAHRFKNAIGSRAREKNGQLEFQLCPYCFGGRNHDKGTFAISLDTGQFECKRASCGVRGNMITLAKDFSDKFELSREVSIYHNIDGRIKFKKFKNAKKPIEVREPAINYLMSRGIPREIIEKYEITTLPNDDRILVFPFRDEDGELTFYKYRNTEPKEGQSKEWSAKGNTKKILFGMNHCEDFGTLVITEGQIDSLSLAAAGIKNAVSVPTGKNGFTWKPNVWNWLLKFEEIVVFGDNENGEITLAREISSFYPKKVRIVRVEDYKGYKDANDLLRACGSEALQEAVNNAEVKTSLRIKNLSDVEQVDLKKLTAYKTYIPSLDEALGGGFHDGELNILTGKCGEGKSTFASQLVGRMVQNGLKCFCYSGELPDFMFRNWLDIQLVGKTDMLQGERNRAGDWYKDRIYIYDDSSVIDEKEELFPVMEEAVKQLGCKFILIDNLMTAMEDKPNEELYRQQSNFVKRLTKFAKGFNVIILLVAHPKKSNTNDNDSISGSGDITNRANIVLRYQRKDQARYDENQSWLMITKNRTTGKLKQGDKSISVIYDETNMRITEEGHKAVEFLPDQGLENMTEEFTEALPYDIPF